MKITIVQTEIEEAIRDFMRKQIAVQEGMVITMDLRATRGDEGFIANIDISPATSTEQVLVRETPAPAQTEPVVVKPRVTKPAAVVTKAAEPAEAEAEVEAQTPTDEPAPVAAQTIADPEPDGIEEVEGAAPLAAKPSIFAGLRRPSSDEAAAA